MLRVVGGFVNVLVGLDIIGSYLFIVLFVVIFDVIFVVNVDVDDVDVDDVVDVEPILLLFEPIILLILLILLNPPLLLLLLILLLPNVFPFLTNWSNNNGLSVSFYSFLT